VSRCQKSKTNLDFTETRDSEWQWHQLGHMQGCTSLQTDNHASTPLLSFLQAGCASCRPTNSVKALKATLVCKMDVNNHVGEASGKYVALTLAKMREELRKREASSGVWEESRTCLPVRA